MAYYVAAALAAVVAVAVFLAQRFVVVKEPHEPPFVPSRIPLIGHLLSLLLHGADFYSTLDHKNKHGIYTLPILGGRMYMVASPDCRLFT